MVGKSMNDEGGSLEFNRFFTWFLRKIGLIVN